MYSLTSADLILKFDISSQAVPVTTLSARLSYSIVLSDISVSMTSPVIPSLKSLYILVSRFISGLLSSSSIYSRYLSATSLTLSSPHNLCTFSDIFIMLSMLSSCLIFMSDFFNNSSSTEISLSTAASTTSTGDPFCSSLQDSILLISSFIAEYTVSPNSSLCLSSAS